jgi:hypothetical protein
LEYWNAWNHWHISMLKKKNRPMLSFDGLANRAFSVPEALTIPRDRIQKCLKFYNAL